MWLRPQSRTRFRRPRVKRKASGRTGGTAAEAHGLWLALGYPGAEEASPSTPRDTPDWHPKLPRESDTAGLTHA